jgi:hypothetical protein
VAILTRSHADSGLSDWAMKLREKIGIKRAAVAVARKLASSCMRCCAPALPSPGGSLPHDPELDSAYGVTRRPCRDGDWSIRQWTLHHEFRLRTCVTNTIRTVPRSPLMRQLRPSGKTTMFPAKHATLNKALAKPAIRRRPFRQLAQGSSSRSGEHSRERQHHPDLDPERQQADKVRPPVDDGKPVSVLGQVDCNPALGSPTPRSRRSAL